MADLASIGLGVHPSDEIEVMELRVKNVPGIKVNHALLSETVKSSDRRLSTVLALVRQVEQDDLPEEERIFAFDMDHLQKQ